MLGFFDTLGLPLVKFVVVRPCTSRVLVRSGKPGWVITAAGWSGQRDGYEDRGCRLVERWTQWKDRSLSRQLCGTSSTAASQCNVSHYLLKFCFLNFMLSFKSFFMECFDTIIIIIISHSSILSYSALKLLFEAYVDCSDCKSFCFQCLWSWSELE